MGCFFGCFGAKDSHSRLKTTPEKERLVHRDRSAISSLFLPGASLESEDDLIRKTEEGWGQISGEFDVRELRDEAKILKACGTLLETPVEIRKVSRRWVDTDAQEEELDSLMTCASTETLKVKDPLDQSSTPVKTCGKWVTGEGFLVGTPSSVLTAGHDTRRDSTSSAQSSENHGAITPNDAADNGAHRSTVSPEALATTVQRTNKSVRFECHSDRSCEDSAQHIKQSGSSGGSSVSMPSPYPTPLHLTDEMQTPGTVFPAYTNSIAGGTTKIRSQYVYSVLNPIESHWSELNEENSDPNHQREPPKSNDEATLKDDVLLKSVKKEELSLSEWMKTRPANQEGGNGHGGENVGRSPGDRPILGMVAAHWRDDEEATHASPKWWGVNGIPNTTTKYKEDQKVSWHATPFEERLEKALSNDTFISQRKQISGGPRVDFDEFEESDTASSQLQSSSSSHLKTVGAL